MENSNYHNWLTTRETVGWVPLAKGTIETWSALGFKCGLEVHQQLKTRQKAILPVSGGNLSRL